MKINFADLMTHVGRILLCVVVFFLFCAGVYTSYSVISDQKIEYRKRVSQLDATNQKIKLAEANLKVMEKRRERLLHPEGVEDVARERLGMIRPGEVAYVIDGVSYPEVKDVPVPENSDLDDRKPSGLLFKVFGTILF